MGQARVWDTERQEGPGLLCWTTSEAGIIAEQGMGKVTDQRKDIMQVSQLQEQLTGMCGVVVLHKARCRQELPPPRACPGLWVLLGGTVTVPAAETCHG